MGITNLEDLHIRNLVVSGNSTIPGLAPTDDDLEIDGDLAVTGALDVTGALTLGTGLAATEIAAMAYETITLAVVGAQTTGVFKAAALIGIAGTIVDVRAKLTTAPVGSTFIVDVNKNGTTIFTTQGNRPTFADGAPASSTTAPDVTAVAAGDHLSVDIDQIGSGTAGTNLMVSVTIKRALI